MAITTSSLIIETESLSPSTYGATLQSGKAIERFKVVVSTPQDLQDAITLILGGTSLDVGDGRLQRTPPLAHPIFPYWYASAIPTIQGVGQSAQAQSQPSLEASSLPFSALYDQYHFTVEFTPRPYAVAPDTSITLFNNQFYAAPPRQQFATTSYKYANEWLRYTDYIVTDQTANVTANLPAGQSFSSNAGLDQDCNTVAFAAMPRLFLPDQTIKMTWYQVPYRFVTSTKSNFLKYKGYINQFAWYDWQAGQLQYQGFNPLRYTPPVQQIALFDPNGPVYSTDKLCDLELTFLVTGRTLRPDDSVAAPYSANWIVNGHNLQPWVVDRSFHYVRNNSATAAQQYPTWFSIPFSILFTDPDA